LVWRQHDTIRQQLEDLVRTRNPQWKSGNGADIEPEIEKLLAGTSLHEYGLWVYYPWSGNLVHVLPPDEFQELRLNRNQNKITAAEQRELAGKTIGVVGLSVGNAIATALAIEGIGGRLKLADFDRLDLSNMNRIRASVHDVGLRKSVLCARQIVEMNPYADLHLFNEGLTAENLETFFGDEPALDAVIDECDDIRLKVLLREVARRMGIPVLMETSDRGMLDVERFDLEPDRQLFHGLLDDISASDVPPELSSEEKIRFVAPLLGIETLSARSAASMLEIGETISTWPQLGSEVQLGGASVCAALRKLFLGGTLKSGRRYIDLDAAIGVSREEPEDTRHDSSTHTPSGDARAEPGASGASELMQLLVQQAVLAPSGGNSQPWRFHTDNKTLWVLHDQQRSRSLLDSDSTAAYVGLGAAIENVRIAAAERGLETLVDYFPQTGIARSDTEAVAALQFADNPALQSSAEAGLSREIQRRMTNRTIYGREELGESARRQLVEMAASRGVQLMLLEGQHELDEIGSLVGAGDRLRMLSPELHAEMMAEVRWTPDEAESTRDGLDLTTLLLKPHQEAAFRLIRRAEVAAFLREQASGTGLTALSNNTISQSSAIGLISAQASDGTMVVKAGQAVQAVWLEATRLGLALHPMTALIYMFYPSFEAGLSPAEQDELKALKSRFERLVPAPADARHLLLFRLSHGEPAGRRALRRSLDDVLFFDQ
jgi:molybdopterin/thiamine biosynthesis adenylyltransferase/nitroreductase